MINPITAITLATLLGKGIGAWRNRSKSRVSNAPGSQAYTGNYPNATPRDSTERDENTVPPGGGNAGAGDGGGAGSGTDTMTDLQRRNALRWGSTGRLEGFQVGDMYGGEEAGMKPRNSVKNTFGRIASRYEAKPSSIDKILSDPDFISFFPNAKKAGFDKIDFGGVKSDFESGTPVYVVDVGNSFDPQSDTGRGWWWGADDGGSANTSSSPSSSQASQWGNQWSPDPTNPDWSTSQSVAQNFTPNVSAMTPEEIWAESNRTFGNNRAMTLGDMSRAGRRGY